MINLSRDTFWNVKISEDRRVIQAIIGKWAMLLRLGKPDISNIKKLYSHFRKFSKMEFKPERLFEYNIDNYEFQKDWITLRTVVISNFYNNNSKNNQPNEGTVLIL